MRVALIFFVFSFLVSEKGFSALCTSTGSGNWNNGASWNCGSVPSCGDSVVILSTHTINFSSNENYTCGPKIAIALYGSLTFANGRKISLPCDSRIYLFSGSSIFVSGGGGSNTIEICNTTFWSSTSGNLSGPACLPPTLPGCATVLPVELFGFKGFLCEKNICLEWHTASEKDNDYFEVQKTENGSYYEKIFNVKSLAIDGNSRQNIKYSVSDIIPTSGLNYYRLKQVDLDGKFSFSPLIAINYEGIMGFDFDLFPNPTSETFVLQTQRVQAKLSIAIVNTLGTITQTIQLVNSKRVEISIPEKGVYFVILEGDGKLFRHKVLVL